MSGLASIKPSTAASRALVDAMGYIRQGWTQGAYCRNRHGTPVMPDGSEGEIQRVDLAWALARAGRERGVPEDHLRALVQAHLPLPYRDDLVVGLERWNDVQWRTRTEVILVLERTLRSLHASL